jgi:hypothetical protein
MAKNNAATIKIGADTIEITNLRKEFKKAKSDALNLGHAFNSLTDAQKNSDVGRKLAKDMNDAIKKAGDLKDQMSDLQAEINYFASDTAIFDSLKEGAQLFGQGLSVAASAAGYFADNEKDAMRMMNLATGIQGAFNTAITVGNMLQHQSATMMGIVKIQEMAAAAAKNVHTGATIAGTIAQKAFNTVAKANPYVLLASVILGAAAAIYGFVSATDDSTEAEKKNIEAGKEMKSVSEQVSESFSKHLAQETVNLVGKYLQLQDAWKNCTTVHQQNQFIKDNAKAFEELNLKVDNVKDAEDVFVNNSDSVLQALNKRAEAAAYAAVQMELYEKAIRAELEVKDINKSLTDRIHNIQKQRARAVGNKTYQGDGKNYHSTGAYAQQREKEAKEARAKAKELGKQRAKAEQEGYDAARKSGAFGYNKNHGNGKSGKSGGKTDKKTTPTPPPPTGSIEALEKKISDLQKERKLLSDPVKISLKDDEIIKAQEELDHLLSTANKASFDRKFGKIVLPKVEVGKDLKNPNNSFEDIKAPQLDDKAFGKFKEQQEKDIDEMIDKWSDLAHAGTSALDSLGNNSQLGNLLGQFVDLSHFLCDSDAQMMAYGKTLSFTQKAAMGVGAGLSVMGQTLQQMGTDGETAKAGAVLAAIGQIILGFANASTQAAKQGPWAWIAATVAGLATVVTTVAQIKGMATGGIVQGPTSQGDKILTRLNSGEMVLNQGQQARMFRLLNGELQPTIGTGGLILESKVRGSDLVLALKNYNGISSKSGRNINRFFQ